MHRTTPQFWVYLEQLPQSVQGVARQNFTLLKANPRHPSLHFGRVGRFWSVRIGAAYRALAVENDEGLIWFWVGSHDEYIRMNRRG